MWPLLLAAVYLALIPFLAGLEQVRGVTYLLGASAVGCLLFWYARYLNDSKGFLGTGKELLGAISDWLPRRQHANGYRVSLPAVLAAQQRD